MAVITPPVDENTYSAAVDRVVTRSGRPDRIQDIMGYVNQTIRECQALQYFARDLIEDQITPTTDPFIWERRVIPYKLRVLRTVRYAPDVYPDFVRPGKKQRDYGAETDNPYFYYAASTYFVFAGVTLNQAFDVAFYIYHDRLPYYSEAVRPARYSIENVAWEYLDGANYVATLGSDALNEAAENKVTNWLLFDWFDVIVEGGLAKIFKNIDDVRSKASFALFKQLQQDILKGEHYETLAF